MKYWYKNLAHVKNKISKLSITFLMMLSFWALGQLNPQEKKQEDIVTKIDNFIPKLYEFSDSSLYIRQLDTFSNLVKQIPNDTSRYENEMINKYCHAILYITYNDYKSAMPLLEHYIDNINPQYQSELLNNYHTQTYQWLGEIKKSQGKYQEAIEAFRNNIAYKNDIPYSIASTEKLIGETYALQGDWRNAYHYYQKSLQRLLTYFPRAKMPQDKIETQKRLIRAYEAIAVYFREKSQLDSVKFYLEKRRPLLSVNTESNMIDSYLLDALLLSETGNYNAATGYYDKALRLAKSQHDLLKIAEIYRNRAEILYKKGSYRVAIIDADSAMLSLLQQGNIVYKKDYLQALAVKTNALIADYQQAKKTDSTQLKNIFSLSQKSIQFIDSVSITYQNLRDKQTLLGLQRSIFSNGIWASEQLFQQTKNPIFLTKAFQFSEQSRSATLRSISQLDQVQRVAGVPDSVIQKDDALRQKIAASEHTLRLGGAIGESPQFLDEFSQLKAARRQFLQEMERQYPNYFALKYQPQISNPNEMIRRLKDNRSVLEFFINKDAVYGFLLTKKGLIFKKLDLTEEVINSQVAEILHFTKGEQDNKTAYQQTAFFLYQKLITPFEADLSEEVVIIPDGNLARLPFETLLYEASEAQCGIAKLPYWIKKHSISYHYAAALLFEEKSTWRKGTDWAIFAPNFSDEPDFQDQKTITFFEKNLKKEYIFKENQATKANFQAKMSNCRLLHINTHGVANDSVGDLSYLRLSDAKFYSGELYGSKIKADLVTLSACQTANGELRYGEGNVGLTLGFLYAGAKSVVSSLWNVNQQSTGAFMQQFYQRLLQEKQANNQALRAAKLAIIEENPNLAHPKYWAAFVLVGEPDAAVINKNYWIWLVALGIVLSLGLLMKRYWVKIIKTAAQYPISKIRYCILPIRQDLQRIDYKRFE